MKKVCVAENWELVDGEMDTLQKMKY